MPKRGELLAELARRLAARQPSTVPSADAGRLRDILRQLPPGATVSDFDQSARPERYALPLDRRPATIRAATVGDRLRDAVRGVYAGAAEQPVGRVMDALGVSDLRGMTEPPPLLSLGMMPDRPSKKLGDLVREVAKRQAPTRITPRTLYHSSPGEYQGGKLPFSAYYGTKDFAKSFPDEFGPNMYAIRLRPASRVLDMTSQEAKPVRDAMARIQWNETAPAPISGDDLYELWTDKDTVLDALHSLGLDDAFDAVKLGEEYIVPSRTIATSKTRRVK